MQPFTRQRRDSVAAWGEERLITALRRWLGNASPPAPHGIGDDCAVLAPSAARQLITVDPVIFGRHFDASIPPRAVAAKLLKRNLSDIAAMGGTPVAAVVALTLDPRVSRRWLEAFHRGLAACARRYHVPIVGGDVSQARGQLAATLPRLGRATGPRVLTRAGARAGDWIYVTGQLGRSLATGHHVRFLPRLAEGRWLAQQRAVRAMMDVSDGLAKDLRALTPAGTMPALDPSALPRRQRATLREALADGEDYELVFVLARRTDRATFASAWHRAFPRTPLSCLGSFVAGPLPAGSVDLRDYHGYEHLR